MGEVSDRTKRGPPANPKEDPKRFKTSHDAAQTFYQTSPPPPAEEMIYGNHQVDFLLCHEEEFPAWVEVTEEEERLFEEKILADLEQQNQREAKLALSWSAFRGVSGRKLPSHAFASPRSRTVERHAVQTARDVDRTPQKDNRRHRMPIDEILEAAPYLRYSWKELHLGTRLGTPAYNEFIRNHGYTSSLTPFQISQIVKSLRARTVFLPPDSELNEFVDHFEDSESEDDKSEPSHQNLMSSMGRLYKEMCRQDADDWSKTYQQQANHWTASAVTARLQYMENKINELRDRENETLQRSREIGLVNPSITEETFRLLGVVSLMDNYE